MLSENGGFCAGIQHAPTEVLDTEGGQVTPIDFALKLQRIHQLQQATQIDPQLSAPRLVYSSESRAPVRTKRYRATSYVKTPTHKAIAYELRQRPASLSAITLGLKPDPSHEAFGRLVGDVAETHVAQTFQDLAASEAFKDIIELSPSETWHVGEFCFIRKGGGGITIYNEREEVYYGELDNLIFVHIEDRVIPTASEVKAHNKNHNGQLVDLFLRDGALNHTPGILEHVYHEKPAVLLVATEGSINPQSDEIHRFKSKGGIVTYMHPSLGELVGYAHRIREESQRYVPIPRQRGAVG